MNQATVFVVDDDQTARESVCSLVEPMDVNVELYSSAEAFLEAYDPDRPGCLVTDLRMMGMNGVELQEELQRRGIDIPTIIISAYADVPVAVRAMRQGAVTVLEKPCRGMELWDAIRSALDLDRKQRDDSARLKIIQQRLDSLADPERDVLERVVSGTPNKAIAKQLDIGLRTVEARRRTIMQKMGVHSVAELVEAVTLVRAARQ